MKSTLAKIAQDAPAAPSVHQSLAIDPTPLDHPSGARVRLALTRSEAAKAGVLNRWHAARERKDRQAQRLATAAVELNLSVLKLLQHAEAQKWSQRRMAKAAGLSWGGWVRCRDAQADPLAWQPRAQAALRKLGLA
jgi:hypothetical protein